MATKKTNEKKSAKKALAEKKSEEKMSDTKNIPSSSKTEKTSSLPNFTEKNYDNTASHELSSENTQENQVEEPIQDSDKKTEVDTVTPKTQDHVNPQEPSPSIESSQDNDDIFAEEQTTNTKKIFIIFLLALLIGIFIVGGYFFIMSQKGTNQSESTSQEQTPSPTISAEESNEKTASDEANINNASEEKEIDLTKYAVQILNGSGVSGEAGRVKNILSDEGFDNFTTGNADSFDYQETIIRMKKSVPPSIFDTISSALDLYSVTQGDDLPDTADYDIVIVVGQKS